MLRLENVNFDARDHTALAAFWCEALGWEKVFEAEGEISISTPGGDTNDPSSWQFPDLVFVPVPEPEAGRGRVHLGLARHSVEEQQATVARLIALGATHADVGQAADVPWVVLADPEGNPFCVLEPRDEYRDVGAIAAVVVAATDGPALREFWTAATGWSVARENERYVDLRDPDDKGPVLALVTRPGLDAADHRKNRIHHDAAPREDDDQEVGVQRLLALGATRVDVGQGPEVTWVVLADPEGNEVCVLSPRP